MIEKLRKIIVEVLEGEQVTITPQTHLRDDLNFDSLQLAQLTVEIEDEFDVDIFENGVINTVQEILDQINE